MKKVKQQINTMISQEEKGLEKKRTTPHTKIEDSIYLSGYIAGLNKALTWVKEYNSKANPNE
tara:strand:- start:1811 stop:1996 length:186 start_codon:yes stop_codon:yes gene_type:complete